MNYRHAFHAGNFADCMKHALLVWLVRALARKPAAFGVLDTHAGAGDYDLAADPALRTGEAEQGIARLLAADDPALADYLSLVRGLGRYPGSPVLIRALLRPQDRLVCCELHPEDAATLRRRFAGDGQVAVHRRDGWEALGALLPPAERRGLVLIDPPFEQPDEFATLAAGLGRAHARFATGTLAAWYPIKHRALVRGFHAALREAGIPDIVAVELLRHEPADPGRLNGSGLVVVNPPWRFEQEAAPILAALARGFGGPGGSIERLADE